MFVCPEFRVLMAGNIFYNCFCKQFSVPYIWPLRPMIFLRGLKPILWITEQRYLTFLLPDASLLAFASWVLCDVQNHPWCGFRFRETRECLDLKGRKQNRYHRWVISALHHDFIPLFFILNKNTLEDEWGSQESISDSQAKPYPLWAKFSPIHAT